MLSWFLVTTNVTYILIILLLLDIPFEKFSWESYLKVQHAKPATNHLFKLVSFISHLNSLSAC